MSKAPDYIRNSLYPADELSKAIHAAYWLASYGYNPDAMMVDAHRHFRDLADHLGFDVMKREPAASPSSNAEAA